MFWVLFPLHCGRESTSQILAVARTLIESAERLCNADPAIPYRLTMLNLSELPLLPNVDLSGVSNMRPTGFMQPRMAVNAAQHKIVNLLKP